MHRALQDGGTMRLFEPFAIKNIELKNRLVMPGMDTNWGDESGNLAEESYRYYEERAKGGVGLIIVEGAYFDRRGSGTQNMLSIAEDQRIEGFARLTQAIKRHGARSLLQIYHAGSQASSFMIGLKAVAPSDVPFQMTGEVPVPLKRGQIKKLIQQYAKACSRAKRAGFNGVEIHAGHGYLLGQFFSPLTNLRTDSYGGCFESRSRFHVEVLRAVRKSCGDDFLICFRINGRDYIEGGTEIEETCRLCRRLEEEGVDLINITGGIFDSPGFPVVPYMSYPRGVFSESAAEVKKTLKKVPVCVVGRINTPEAAEAILTKGQADLVAIGRALIADPSFPNKVREKREIQIRPCIGCNTCLNQIMIEQPVACSINPDLFGSEVQIEPAPTRQRVLVVGAGIAGLETSRIAALRGHKVLLIEKNSKIGGNLQLASVAPMKREVALLLPYFEALLNRLSIELRLKTTLDASILETFGPDVVVLATGTIPETPELPGLKPERYSTYRDILVGEIPRGENIIILGGGMIGIEVAEYLGCHDRIVTILESGNRVGHDLYPLVAREVIKLIDENNRIRVQLETTPERIDGERLICQSNGQTVTYTCDHIVSARRKQLELAIPAEVSEKDFGSARIIRVGDCRSPGKIMDAVHEAYRIGMSIGEKVRAEEHGGKASETGDLKTRIASKIKSGGFSLEDIPAYLEILVKACNSNSKIQKKTKSTRLKFQFAIEGEADYWIAIERGRFSTGAGRLENPDVTIRMGAGIAPGIFAGSVNAASAYMTKELSFVGPMRHGIAFRNWVNAAKEEMGL